MNGGIRHDMPKRRAIENLAGQHRPRARGGVRPPAEAQRGRRHPRVGAVHDVGIFIGARYTGVDRITGAGRIENNELRFVVGDRRSGAGKRLAWIEHERGGQAGC
jgi:hypothetical protein